jgi:hypothetical protein
MDLVSSDFRMAAKALPDGVGFVESIPDPKQSGSLRKYNYG